MYSAPRPPPLTVLATPVHLAAWRTITDTLAAAAPRYAMEGKRAVESHRLLREFRCLCPEHFVAYTHAYYLYFTLGYGHYITPILPCREDIGVCVQLVISRR